MKITESAAHINHIDGLMTFNMVLCKKCSMLFLYPHVVWCGVTNDMLTGTIILDDHTTRYNCLNFLKIITRTSRGYSFGYTDCYIHITSAWRGTSPLYLTCDGNFNDISLSSWISHGCAINWPPRSPGPNPIRLLFVGLNEE
jgi:hypothetical protein